MKLQSEAVRILLALIDANIENVNLFTFEGFRFATKEEEKAFKMGFKDGARHFLWKLKTQLGVEGKKK